MSKTFFQFSSVNLIERLSKVIPALFTSISIPSNCLSTLSINSSILSCSSNLNFSAFIPLKLFFKFSSLVSFVPVANILDPRP